MTNQLLAKLDLALEGLIEATAREYFAKTDSDKEIAGEEKTFWAEKVLKAEADIANARLTLQEVMADAAFNDDGEAIC